MVRGDEDWCGQKMLFHWLSRMKVGTNQQGFPNEALSTVTATRQAAVVQRQEPSQAVKSSGKSDLSRPSIRGKRAETRYRGK